MKQSCRLLFVLFVAVVYSILLLESSPIRYAVLQIDTHHSNYDDPIVQSTFGNILGVAAQPERLIVSGKINTPVSLKTNYSGAALAVLPFFRFYNSFFSQYESYNFKIIGVLLQATIIFPFHYFW